MIIQLGTNSIPQTRAADLPNINTKELSEWIPKKYDFIKVRLRFLGFEVDVELLEIVAGIAVWVVWTDIANLLWFNLHNNIYDLAFRVKPVVWAVVGGSVGIVHLVSILCDRSCSTKPCTSDSVEGPCPTEPLRYRTICMALAFLYNLAITLSVVAAHSYTLVWKFMLLFSIASFWSHIRLRKQYRRLVKKQRERGNIV